MANEKLFAALVKATNELKNPIKNQTAGEGKFEYDYIDLAAVLDAVKPQLLSNELFISQTTNYGPDDKFVVETILGHSSGEFIKSSYPIKLGAPQDMGAQITYARRYSICSMLSIAADADTDGKTPSKSLPTNNISSVGPVKVASGAVLTRPNSQAVPDESFLNNVSFARYKIQTGKQYKGVQLWQISDKDLVRLSKYFQDYAKEKGMPMPKEATQDVESIQEYISSKLTFEADRGDNFI